MKRRKFILNASSAFILLASGQILKADHQSYSGLTSKRLKLRFVIASDGHYGQPNTEYEKFFKDIVEHINSEHAKKPFEFCMINGDIIHDDKTHTPAAKRALDLLKMKYYVSQGNHDKLTIAEWEQHWQMPTNLHFSIGKNGFIIASTSNESGTYLSPDMAFMSAALEGLKHKKNVFIFIHINPSKMTPNAVDTPEFIPMIKKYQNVRAVFNGHDHDYEKIFLKEEVPFIFDAHFGGSWGTNYRGYRIVELYHDNTIATWVMNPSDRINEAVI